MKHIRTAPVHLLAAALFIVFSPYISGGNDAPSIPPPYVGSLRCASCHQIQYKGWVNTFHSTVVQDARKNPEAILGDFSNPKLPFEKKDVWYTIGGHWDQRYLTKIDDDFFVLPRLWSVQSKKWRPYSTWAWKRRPYSKYCAGCHSVAYNPDNRTYAEHTIGCEACHGPGEEHVNSPQSGNIVNPESLPDDLADMICASCHVRGKDITGNYFFPVGYKPGDDLSRYLIPLENQDGKSGKDNILRLWKKWKEDREDQARSRCEVCGIHQGNKPRSQTNDVTGFCLGCHEYGDNLEKHTHHSAGVNISCNDCHRQKDNPVATQKKENVHSYSYFLVHPLNCWDKDIYKRCGKCHGDKGEGWAFRIYNEWISPKMTGH